MPQENFFDNSSQFGHSNGFALAVSFVDYFGENVSDKEISKYVDIQIGYTFWGIEEIEGSYWYQTPLETHDCTLAELNAMDEPSQNSQFFHLKS